MTSAIIKDTFRELTDVSKINIHSLGAEGATSAVNARYFERQPCVRAIGGIVGCVWVLYAESGATLLEGVW